MDSDDVTPKASGELGSDHMPADQISEPIKRRSRWGASGEALRYITHAERDRTVKVRDSDKVTALALVFVSIFALLALVIPLMAVHRIALVSAADILMGVTLVLYVTNRLGIVTTFSRRKAVLTWQLVLGASLLGVFLAANFVLLIAVLIGRITIVMPGR